MFTFARNLFAGLFIGFCVLMFFLAAVTGYHGAIEEVGGIIFTSWVVGVGTGALGVGLVWWCREKMRRDQEAIDEHAGGLPSIKRVPPSAGGSA